MNPAQQHPTTAPHVRALDRCFRGPAWHGPTLLSSIKGVQPDEASWRPGPTRHNIWELVVHCAYWKYRVCALITSLPRGSFGLKGSNFFERPGEAVWSDDIRLLHEWHERLRTAVMEFDPERLLEPFDRSGRSFEMLIEGIASHDV